LSEHTSKIRQKIRATVKILKKVNHDKYENKTKSYRHNHHNRVQQQQQQQ
jgi:hypothetical protein